MHRNNTFIWLFGGISILLLLLLVPSSIPVASVGAQGTGTGTMTGTLPLQDSTREFDEKITLFFEQLKSGSTNAFENLVQNSPLGAAQAGGQIADMRTRFEETQSGLYGNMLAWEKHGTKRIGEDITVVRYILKYENYPMIWTFTFYRKPADSGTLSVSPAPTSFVNPNPWTLIEMRFDSNLDILSL